MFPAIQGRLDPLVRKEILAPRENLVQQGCQD